MSIRLRLTLWQTALLALVLAAFAGVVYVTVARQERGAFDAALGDRAANVARAIGEAYRQAERGGAAAAEGGSGGSVGGRPGPGRGGPGLSPAEASAALTGALGDGGDVAQALDLDRREVGRSANLAEPLPLSDEGWARALAGEPVLETVEVSSTSASGSGGEEMRLRAETGPPGPGGPQGVLLVASPLEPLATTLRGWRLILAAAVLGTTTLAAAIGWFVASRAMRPVDQMTRAARGIGQSADLSRRLPEPRQLDELGRLARTFNEMLGRLGEAFEQQRRFLADASHELRTPLTTVRMDVEALRRGAADDPAERDETLRAVARETERMGRLVADLLTLARADAGQELARERLALDALALDVYQQALTLADGVRVELDEWEQVEVEGDPDRLKQVMLNLVDNALRHTPAGGTVTLGLSRRGPSASSSQAEAVLRVRDTGPGIAPDLLGRIFERFYRVDRPRSRAAGGTGLGLAIAREVAEAHGGRIEVESRVGDGSTFSLVLPVARPEAAAPRGRGTAGSAAALGSAPARPLPSP